MGRREDRAELESTWTVYEPRVAGQPITRKDMDDAGQTLPSVEQVLEWLAVSDHGCIQMSPEEWEALRPRLEAQSAVQLVYDAANRRLREAP